MLKIREQWGHDRVVNTLIWEIARLRKSVRLLFARTIALHGYVPKEIIVPDDPAIDRLYETEPAITDDAAKKHAGYNSLFTESERELNEKRERRGVRLLYQTVLNRVVGNLRVGFHAHFLKNPPTISAHRFYA